LRNLKRDLAKSKEYAISTGGGAFAAVAERLLYFLFDRATYTNCEKALSIILESGIALFEDRCEKTIAGMHSRQRPQISATYG